MKDTDLFIAVALFKSPTEMLGPSSCAAMLVATTSPTKALEVVRKIDGSMSFESGGYVAIYKSRLGEDFSCYKCHRIGDDLLSGVSPIVFIKTKTGEGWLLQWFDRDFWMQHHAEFGSPNEVLEFVTSEDIRERVQLDYVGGKHVPTGLERAALC